MSVGSSHFPLLSPVSPDSEASDQWWNCPVSRQQRLSVTNHDVFLYHVAHGAPRSIAREPVAGPRRLKKSTGFVFCLDALGTPVPRSKCRCRHRCGFSPGARGGCMAWCDHALTGNSPARCKYSGTWSVQRHFARGI